MKRSLVQHLVVYGLVLQGLAVSLAVASLLIVMLQTDGLMRYPEAQDIGKAHLRLDTLAKGYVIYASAYRSPHDASTVMAWYVRSLELEPVEAGGGMSNCASLRKSGELPLLRQMIGVTICSQRTGTLIFVNRSLAVRQ